MVTTIRLPDELHEGLKRQAERKGMTFNAHVLSMLWDMQECQPVKDAAEVRQRLDKPVLQANSVFSGTGGEVGC